MLYSYHLVTPRIFGTWHRILWYTAHKIGTVQEDWDIWEPYIHSVLSFACWLLMTYFVYLLLSVRVILPFFVYFSGDPGRDFRELELCCKCSSGDCKTG